MNEQPKTAIEQLVENGWWFWFDGNGPTSGQWLPGSISRDRDDRNEVQQIQFNEMVLRFCGYRRDYAINAEVTLRDYEL
jgi:hypothetical protein